MHSYAQTNIQLFNQLRRDGYSNTELSCIVNAYKLVMYLFTGWFRPSGKPFIAHLVGTASILGSLHAPVEVVAAGLLHAAYTNGDFGNGGNGISNAKSQQIRCAVGKDVEEYISKYTAFKWYDEQIMQAIHDGLDLFGPIERYVLLIRLANELEEHLDLGLLYGGEFKHQQYNNHNSYLMVKMAEKLGFPTLAIELARVLKETASAETSIERCHQSAYNASFLIAPKSYQRGLSTVLHHWLISMPHHLFYTIVRRLHTLCSATDMKTKFRTESQSE